MSEDPIDPPIGGLPAPRETPRVVGHRAARDIVTSAWRDGRLHHALLLTGARGIGKATLAYAIARMVIDESASLDDNAEGRAYRQIAGGACQSFRRLARGISKEGKVRTSIGVDEVRALAPFLRQRLDAGAWRVVLVDAVDDLNPNSANALLKILEEPGDRTLFLLAAHSEAAALATIRSRCTALRLDALTDAEMREVLAESALDQSAIDAALPKAEGSVRRAVLLAESGGAEALAEIEALLRKPVWSIEDAQAITERVSLRADDVLFDVLADGLSALLARKAVAAAGEKRGAEAARLSELASRTTSDLALKDEYGVDRRLALRGTLSRVHAAMWPDRSG